MILTGTLQKLKGSLEREGFASPPPLRGGEQVNMHQSRLWREESPDFQSGVLQTEVQYSLCIGEALLPLNALLGQTLHFEFTGNIFCNHCGKKTKKSYQQGYCYPCASTLARCDICIVRPEKCHFHLNTCREPQWGQTHCMIPHIVYLSNTSNLKVGITRETQIPTRWIDQGATEALPIARVPSRYEAGKLEIQLAQYMQDKTNWREMLKGCNESIDLHKKSTEIRKHHFQENPEALSQLSSQKPIKFFEPQAAKAPGIEWLNETIKFLQYPVLAYPKKILSINAEKEKQFSSMLQGIKGQYLILEKGVMNIRNLSGYELKLQIP